MKKTVKIACFLIALLLLFCSCGKKKPEPAETTTEPTLTQQPTETAPLTVSVTFPEGFTVYDIAQRLEENGVCSASSFLSAADNESLAREYGFSFTDEEKEHRAFLLEGYIFPDTYEFYLGEDAGTALGRFLENAAAKLLPSVKDRAKKAGFTLDDILTLASVIQKEARSAQMREVSSVLHNRLSQEMMLQCDATIDYVENSLEPYFGSEANDFMNYYNTYKCYDLPVGPICCPGMEAIEAALSPESTDYLYFVTDSVDPDVFYFACDYDTHLDNCEKAGW